MDGLVGFDEPQPIVEANIKGIQSFFISNPPSREETTPRLA
jgi:hypothetical protein